MVYWMLATNTEVTLGGGLLKRLISHFENTPYLSFTPSHIILVPVNKSFDISNKTISF